MDQDTFTMKALDRIEKKLDALDIKLDAKADLTFVHELAAHLRQTNEQSTEIRLALDRRVGTLENVVVRRDGPLIQEHLFKVEKQVDTLDETLDARIAEGVREASSRAWSVRAKVFVGACTLVSAAAAVAAIFVALPHH